MNGTRFKKGLRQLLSSSPTDRRNGRKRALSLFSLLSHLLKIRAFFYGSQHSLGEVFCYFYKSNAFSFFGGAKKESAIAWSRGSTLFWSNRPKFTPCDRMAVACPSKRTDGLIHLISQKMSGATDTFSCPRWTRLRTKCAQACLRKFFRIAKKLASQSATPKATKKRRAKKAIFEW